MAFNKYNELDLQTLSDEESLDPIIIGYSSVAGQTKKTLDLLNLADSNTELVEVNTILTPENLLEAIQPEDLTIDAKFPDGARTWLQLLFEASNTLQDDLSANRDKILELFNENPQTSTYTAIAALQTKLSRAEVLYGQYTEITRDDWAAVLDWRVNNGG